MGIEEPCIEKEKRAKKAAHNLTLVELQIYCLWELCDQQLLFTFCNFPDAKAFSFINVLYSRALLPVKLEQHTLPSYIKMTDLKLDWKSQIIEL